MTSPPAIPYDRKEDPISQAGMVVIFLSQFLIMGGSGPRWWFMLLAFTVALATLLLDRRFGYRGVAPRIRVAVIVGASITIVVLANVVGGMSWQGVSLLTFFVLIMMWGYLLIFFAWTGRIVNFPHCAACMYETGPLDNLPDQCPECGNAWLVPGGIAHMRRVRRLWLLVPGIALMVAGFAGALPGWNLVMRVMPAPVVFQSVRETQYLDSDLWSHIQSRPLSPQQQVDLAAALLDRRAAGLPMVNAPLVWLDGMADSLPPDLRRRYYLEMLDARFVEGRTGNGGAGRVARLHMMRRRTAMGVEVALLLGPIVVNGAEITPTRTTPELVIRDEYGPPISIPEGKPAVITARAWVIVGPTRALLRSREVTFADDGRPVFPEARFIEEIHRRLDVGP